MAEENSEKKEVLRTIVLLLIGFVVGFASHAYVSVTGTTDAQLEDTGDLAASEMAGDDMVSDEDTKSAYEAVIPEPVHTFNAIPNNTATDDYSVSVTDQAAGNVVYVTQIDLGEPTWVAVREDAEGTLGNILGAGWYSEGKTSGVIELLRDTEPNSFYYVVLYKDDGDKQFDHKIDTLVSDTDSNILVTKFRTY